MIGVPADSWRTDALQHVLLHRISQVNGARPDIVADRKAYCVTTSQPTIPVIGSISPLADTSDAWLVDVWGVIHNGVQAIESSCAACAAFRDAGGYVVLITNAPRPAAAVVEQLERVGVAPSAYDAVITSGDVTRGLVQAWSDQRIHHLGPDRDLGIFSDIDVQFSTSLDAEIVVCTGLLDDESETPDDYAIALKGFRRRNLLMLCANPDLKVERGKRIVYCAGAIAKAYEDLGGDVVYSGKPHLPIYELALDMVNRGLGREIAKERVLAIGDGILTDIAGAAAAQLRSVYIASGIHVPHGSQLDAGLLDQFFGDFGEHRPVAAMTSLTW